MTAYLGVMRIATPSPVIMAIALAFTLWGCVGGEPTSQTAKTVAPRTNQQSFSPSAQACYAGLGQQKVNFEPLQDKYYGGGCSAVNSVKLIDVGTPVTGLGAMTCGLADKFAGWVRYGVGPAAYQILGSKVAKVETMGTYSCRPIAGSSKLSEHGHSNAVDVAAFVLADGRRVSVQAGWRGNAREQEFLKTVRASACKRFGTVLSPDYNAAHADHLHFDMSGQGYCR